MQHYIKVINDSREMFDSAMNLVFLSQYEKARKVNGYRIIDDTLYLSNYSSKPDVVKFPYDMTPPLAVEFAWGWLKSTQPSGHEPDTDGSTKMGFEVKSEMSYILSEDWGLFVAIKPVWIVYGK